MVDQAREERIDDVAAAGLIGVGGNQRALRLGAVHANVVSASLVVLLASQNTRVADSATALKTVTNLLVCISTSRAGNG